MLVLDEWLSQRIDKTKEAGLYRKVRMMNSPPLPKVRIDGQEKIVFSSNNYLGLAYDQSLVYAAETILHEFGVGSSGLRLTTGHTDWHKKIEEKSPVLNKRRLLFFFQAVI